MRTSFRDRVVWITGASAGVGAALAHAFAARGARLVLSARRAGRLEEVAARCTDRGAARAHVVPLDLAEHAALAGAAREAEERVGPVDVLVHNAGVGQRGRAEETRIEVVRRIFDVNVFGPVALTQAVLPGMLARGAGRIAVVSSILGKFGAPGRSAYAASKHALHGYFDSVRAEVHDRGVRVTLVCPGYVRTEISTHALEPGGAEHQRLDPGQARGMDPHDCARRVLRAIARGRREVTIGGWETWGVTLKRFAPGVLARLLRGREVD